MANHLNLTPEALDKYIGKAITELCPLKFGTIGDEHNHCAHFVGHALTLNHDANVGTTCAAMVWAGRKRKDEGACIRVNEVFNRCDDLDGPDEKGCLAYITIPSNVKEENGVWVMGSHKRKHIGIYLAGCVWHYGNTKDKVKKQPLAEFEKHYSGKTVVRFTVFPQRAVFVPA